MQMNPPIEKAQNSDKFTLEYFHAQVLEMRRFFGDKTFWAKTAGVRQAAVNGLAFVYFNVVTNDAGDEQHAQAVYEATMREYTTREAYLALRGLVNTQP